jgi:hypothetical protein
MAGVDEVGSRLALSTIAGVHKLLTSSTYCGHHYFNRFGSCNGRPRPPSQWVAVQIPAMIDEGTFNSVQALLQSRNPKRVAPRVVNGPTLLAGTETEAGIARLLTLVEEGTMAAEDPSLKERLVGLKVRRDELASELADLQKRMVAGEPAITPEKLAAFGALLKDKLRNGPPDLKQAYARLVLREVSVRDKEIRISGSKAILARAASRGLDKTAPAVLSFVQEWRAGDDEDENFIIIVH